MVIIMATATATRPATTPAPGELAWAVVHENRVKWFDTLHGAISFGARVWNASGGDLVRVIDVYGSLVEEFEG